MQSNLQHSDEATASANDKSADAALLRAIVSGDESAFAKFLDAHINQVHHFVLRTTNRPNDADDLVQEVFLQVWRKAGQFSDARAGVTTWLLSIARNLCIDQHRRSKARPTGHSVPDGQPMIDALTNDSDTNNDQHIDQHIDKTRQLNLLRAAIADLPERQRTAITLCQLQGHSNAHAAAILNIKIAAVESLLARARRALRDALTASEPVTSS